ncbi:hypothetical protein HMPREF0650_0786 [Hoylesella buccalis ATCC 35310]|uniref:Uncharacterized protein n=1 Tax=Hoylesella buccalis ATCC 35310 TaxID=679190 RepID=D1W5C1_9BACT|nr:hypothetical protein HMPREF0650_0786 [Hoylesella buccalis ATCC 35310]
MNHQRNKLIYKRLVNNMKTVSKSIEFGYQSHGDWMAKSWRLDVKVMEIEIHPL